MHYTPTVPPGRGPEHWRPVEQRAAALVEQLKAAARGGDRPDRAAAAAAALLFSIEHGHMAAEITGRPVSSQDRGIHQDRLADYEAALEQAIRAAFRAAMVCHLARRPKGPEHRLRLVQEAARAAARSAASRVLAEHAETWALSKEDS